MTTDTVLRSVQALLDNKPMLHEPGGHDDPEYNEYVRYTSWRWLLLDHLSHETNPRAKAWLQAWLVQNADRMRTEIQRQHAIPDPRPASQGPRRHFNGNMYDRGGVCTVNYTMLLADFEWAVNNARSELLAAEPTPHTLDVATAPAEANPGAPAKPGAKDPQTAVVYVAASKSQAKRKLTAEDGAHAPQVIDQQHAASDAQQSERSAKRTKTDPEVIDLT